MRLRTLLALSVALLIVIAAPEARADCSSPTASESATDFDFTNHVLRYCDGTNWLTLSTTGASQWSDGSSGAIYYNGGNVGIGTTSPGAALEVSSGDIVINRDGSSDSTLRLRDTGVDVWKISRDDSQANALVFYGYSGQSGNIVFQPNGSSAMTIAGNGNVGIGTTSPSYKLDVQGSGILIRGLSSGGGEGYLALGSWGVYCQTGSCGGTASWTLNSDRRLKTDIRDLSDDDGLSSILKLRPVRFHWKDRKMDAQHGEQLGFIAQEAETVFPEVVNRKGMDTEIDLGDGQKATIKDAKSMSYSNLVVPLVKAVQELKADNDNLRTELEAADDNYASDIDELRSIVEEQGRDIERLKAAQ